MAGDYGERQYYVYIMANSRHQIYVGVTGNLVRRVYQHKNKLTEGHASKYNMQMLVYYESTSDVNSAIAREKQLKGWKRRKKDALIATKNPRWVDLSLEWFDSEGV
ncbi:MAG: GIY-YIG nuclease family protein [Chloroflexi bacterium]|nr:GIY-YIG nuclease family protein [Chloroflexota bacterium]